MKNVNVLLAVVLCAGLCVLFGLFNRSADESLGWSPNDMYMQSILSSDGSSFTSANLSGGNVSNDGVAVSMRNGSFSLRTRTRHASSPSSLVANGAPAKSADFWGALSPNSPIANGVPGKSADFWGAFSPNSLIGYMTSSAEYHSFGGGSNMAMGSYNSSSNNLIASSPAIGSYSQSPIAYNPIASSPNNLIAYSSSNGEVQVAAEQALMSASSSASGLFGSALQNTYGTASYGDYVGMSSGQPSGVRGRQNATPGVGGGGSTYADWLQWFDLIGWTYGTDNGNGNFTFDNAQAEAAYAAWASSRSPELPIPSYAEWLKWLMSKTSHNGKDGNTYSFVPVGNILPLFLMALLYMIILFVKRNKTAQL